MQVTFAREIPLFHTKEHIVVSNKFAPLQDLDSESKYDNIGNATEGKTKNAQSVKNRVNVRKHLTCNVSDPVVNVQENIDQNSLKNITPIVNNTILEDKYTLGLLSIARKCDKLKKARTSAKNALFRAQNHQMFGFIPLDGVPKPSINNTDFGVMGPLEAHNILKNQDIANFQGLQIPVHSSLNVTLFEQLLKDYWDTQLPAFLKYGFPLCIDKNHVLKAEKINHKSATDHPGDVLTYLKEELEDKAILGPFKEPPVGIHTTPFMTREKPGAKNRRVIVDLTWPSGTSVNAGVDSDTYAGAEFILTFPLLTILQTEF